MRAVVAGTLALVRGNNADPAMVRRAVAEVDRHAAAPSELLGAGAQLLAAFGEIALFDVASAARRVLVAGGDADLARLNVADRALGLEMLVALAVADGDLDAAEAWADRDPPAAHLTDRRRDGGARPQPGGAARRTGRGGDRLG